MVSSDPAPTLPPWLAALAGWVVPGLGHVLAGERWRGVTVFAAVITMLVGGLFIGGVRVVDLPGFAEGRRLETRGGDWILTSRPVAAITSRPWFIAQGFAGPAAFAAGYGGVVAASRGYPKPTARLADIGVLYVAAAGMVNFIAMLDAASRASRPRGAS